MGSQFAQELGRLRQRLDWIERIVKKPLCGRHRHKLGDTLTPLTRARYRPHSIGPKAALLPNDSSKEFERQAVCARRGPDHLANGQ